MKREEGGWMKEEEERKRGRQVTEFGCLKCDTHCEEKKQELV